MRVLSNMQTFPCCIIISFKLIWYGDNMMKWISFISLFAWVAHIKRIFPPLPLNSLGMSLKIYPVVILMLMRLFSRKHSRCCLASWRKNRRVSPLAGIRIFLACFESLCPKHVCFNISHWLIDSLHIYDKFPGQYLSGALLHRWTHLSGEREGESQASGPGKHWLVTASQKWLFWSGVWHVLGRARWQPVPKLQGPSQPSPPGVVTFCQSLCCACIDAKGQAGGKVLFSAP